MTGALKSKWTGLAITAILAVIAPLTIHPLFAMQILCFALFASAFNLLAGFLGRISFGHAAFFGLAAYLTGHAVKVWGWPPELGLLYAAFMSALLGFAFGFLAVERKGVYFAMITLALSQLVYFFCHQSPFTGGEDGMPGIPRGILVGIFDLSNNTTMYVFTLTVVTIGHVIIWRAINSPFGKLMLAVRDNEQRVVSLGYDTFWIKVLAVVLSATLAGVAGGLKALVFQFASEADIIFMQSGTPLLASLIGGIGTLPGPIIGAALMVAMENVLASFGEWVFFIQGSIFVLVVMFFRKGIWGEVQTRILGEPISGTGGGAHHEGSHDKPGVPAQEHEDAPSAR